MGGVQISFPRGSGASLCTYGFNARLGSTPYFLTNSHCTARQGGNQGTPIYQPSVASGNRIGTEVFDPNYFSGGDCPPGRRCRYSDVAVIRPSVAGAFGQLTRTAGVGSFQVVGTFDITSVQSNVATGARLNKIGRTTGWTRGRVEFTCANVNVSGSNLTLLCQNGVRAGVNGGDSGSPVFSDLGSGNARLRGILWGGGGGLFIYSPINLIRAETSSNLRFN